MKNLTKNINIFIGLASVAFATSCAPELESFEPSAGSQANFSKYIAIGNSLTAGFADGGLYLEGQKVAYPNLIAEQLKQVGSGAFSSPFFAEANRNGSGYLVLESLVNGTPVTKQVTDALAYRSEGKLIKYTEPIQNLGVPGMRLDLSTLPVFSAMNMYFERLLPDAEVGKTSYQDYTSKQDYTFFSFWLGNNDALGYAMNGAYDEGNGTTGLTSAAAFKAIYTSYITKLTEKGQKGVVATIPNVTAIPFLNTVTTARILAGVSAATGGTVKAIYISTSTIPRPATDEDLFALNFNTAVLGNTVDSDFPYGFDPRNPLHDRAVLDKDEIVEINTRVNEYNKVISEIATEKNLALADANAFLNRVKSPGIMVNGMGINASFITGNAFSLDGVHLTPIGNALVANLFIDAINAKYSSKISKVDVSNYSGVKFP